MNLNQYKILGMNMSQIALTSSLLALAAGCGQNAHFKDRAAAAPLALNSNQAAAAAERGNSAKDIVTATQDAVATDALNKLNIGSKNYCEDLKNIYTAIYPNRSVSSKLLDDNSCSVQVADKISVVDPKTGEKTTKTDTSDAEIRNFPAGTTLEVKKDPAGNITEVIVRNSKGIITERFHAYGPKVVMIVMNPDANEKLRPARLFMNQQLNFSSGVKLAGKSKAMLYAMAQSIFSVVHEYQSDLKAIRIEGHTDDIGNPDNNKVLSLKRAETVKALLVKLLDANALIIPGVDWNKVIIAEGIGKDRPKTGPSTLRSGRVVFTRADRAKNRRVEFYIDYKN